MSDKTLARRTAVKLYFKGRDISKDLSKYLLSLPHCQVVNSDFMKLSSLSCDLSNINDIIGTVK